jgi:hypothetical protein
MNSSKARSLRVLASLLISMPAVAMLAADPAPVQLLRTINDPHPEEQRNFGWTLDTFNNNLLVGSYGGSVYVFNPNTGAEILRLQSPEPFGSFGRSVTQFGSMIVVGANELDIAPHVRVGSAYVFDGLTGAHLRTFRNPNPDHFGWFGFSMESTAGKLFVSADSASTGEPGRVYVYGPDSTSPIGSLANPQAASSTAWGFGFNMEDHHGDLFVSALGANFGSQQVGAVYRFDGNSLALELTIPNPQPQSGANFGRSLDSNSTHLLVGAPGHNISGTAGAGAAYLFNAETGSLLRTFLNPEPQQYANFGDSVALLGNYAIFGAPGNSPIPGRIPLSVGAAYVFDIITGSFVAKIASPSPGQNEWFTTGDGNTLTAIGGFLAAGHAFNGENTGTVYLFSVPEPSAFCLALFAALGIVPRKVQRRRQ